MWGPRNDDYLPAHEIVPGKLWLGSTQDANDAQGLKALGIWARLNVRTTQLANIEGIKTYWHPLVDWWGNDPEMFERPLQRLETLMDWDVPTLLHCHKGISRSVSVAASWLSKTRSCSFDEGVAEIKRLRYFVNPQEGVRDIARYCLGETWEIAKEPDW